jgi:hypothetical protein
MRKSFESGEDGFEFPLLFGGAYARLTTAFTDYRKRTENALRERYGHKFSVDAYMQLKSQRREVALKCLAANAVSLFAMHDDYLPAHDGQRRVKFVTLRLFKDGDPFVAPEDQDLPAHDSVKNLYTLPLASEFPPSLVSSHRVQSLLTVEEWAEMPKIRLDEGDCTQIVAAAEGWQPIILLRDPGPDGLEVVA